MGHSCHLCLLVARSVFRVVFAEGHWSVGYRRKRGPGWLRKGSASSPSYATELQIKATRGLFWEMARNTALFRTSRLKRVISPYPVPLDRSETRCERRCSAGFLLRTHRYCEYADLAEETESRCQLLVRP